MGKCPNPRKNAQIREARGESAQAGGQKRVKGGIPLAGSRDSVPCGGWGSAPIKQVRPPQRHVQATHAHALNSEAPSAPLPRSGRSVIPQSNPHNRCRARWRDQTRRTHARAEQRSAFSAKLPNPLPANSRFFLQSPAKSAKFPKSAGIPMRAKRKSG